MLRVASSSAVPIALVLLGAGCSSDSGIAPEVTSGLTSIRLLADAVRVAWSFPATATSVELFRSRLDANGGWIDEGRIGAFGITQTGYLDEAVFESRYRYRFRFLGEFTNVVSETRRSVCVPSYGIQAEAPQVAADDPFMVSMGDVDGDGRLEVLGSWNDGTGSLVPEPSLPAGLDPLFANDRRSRDARLADLDGDGDLDVVANTYSSIDDASSRAMLLWNDGTGVFHRDAAFEQLDIRGYGETILTFDYDNDGDLDIFLPYYTHSDPLEQNYLLRNDNGSFVDVAHEAGVAMQGIDVDLRVEGAHAADLNDDGWIDFYVGSHLFVNRADGTFVDVRAEAGLPLRFDEGAFFTDWDLDGDLDLILHHPGLGPELYEMAVLLGTNPAVPIFERVPGVFPVLSGTQRYGASGGDFNLDGYEDLQIASSTSASAVVLVHRHDFYEHVTSTELALPGLRTDSGAIGDLDADGVPDIVRRVNNGPVHFQRGTTPVDQMPVIEVLVTGVDGQHNQQGRVVRLSPIDEPGVVITRVVDGGSGFMSQRPYAMRVGSPYPGPHRVEIRFADRTVEAVVDEGDLVEIRSSGFVWIEPAGG